MPLTVSIAAGRRKAWAPFGCHVGLILAVLAMMVLQGCGGASGDAEAPAPSQALPELSGRVSNGSSPTNVGALQITVKGRTGTARTAEGRLAPIDGTDYRASLDQLGGPYLLSDSNRSPSTLSLYSVATAPGTANLTPLTTLLVAQLLAAAPGPYFEALGTRGGFTEADESAIAVAEQRVRRYLQREFGFEIPPAVGPFVTTPFSRTPGDPMFDTLQALVARIGTEGDIGNVVVAVAQEAARCRVERVGVVSTSTTDEFCPFGKSNAVDRSDPGLRVLGFQNRRGDDLTIRLRGTVVWNVTLTTAEGVVRTCSAAACTGASAGTPAGDGTQSLELAGTPLDGAAGEVILTGSLRTAVPGLTLPGLPCTSNFFYLIDEAAGSASGYCATPDDFGLGVAGQSQPSGATRRRYTFHDGGLGPYLEVTAEGRDVVSVLLYTADPATGLPVARFQCWDKACPGVTLGESTIDSSLGVPIVVQPIRLDRANLAAVLTDGSLSTSTVLTLEATLSGYHVDDPNALAFRQVACARGAARVTARPIDQASTITVCEPTDSEGFELRSAFVDDAGDTVYSIASLLTDGSDNYTAGNTVRVTVSPRGDLVSVTFDQFEGPRYECRGPACSGVTLARVNAQGERRITFAQTVLQELGTASVPADRSVMLDGRIIGPRP